MNTRHTRISQLAEGIFNLSPPSNYPHHCFIFSSLQENQQNELLSLDNKGHVKAGYMTECEFNIDVGVIVVMVVDVAA